MPRQNRRRNKNNNGGSRGSTSQTNIFSMMRNGGANRVVTDAGQTYFALSTNASGNFVTALSPNVLSTRTATLAESYNLYRFKEFALEFYPVVTPVAAGAVSIIVDTIDSVSSSSFNIGSTSELPFTAIQTIGCTVPQRIQIPSSALRGKSAAMWFKSNATSSVDAWDENHLTLVASAASATVSSFVMKLMWVIEFCDPAPAALVPRPFLDYSEAIMKKRELEAVSNGPQRTQVSLVGPVSQNNADVRTGLSRALGYARSN